MSLQNRTSEGNGDTLLLANIKVQNIGKRGDQVAGKLPWVTCPPKLFAPTTSETPRGLFFIVNIQILLVMTSSLRDVSSDSTRMRHFYKIKSSLGIIHLM